jgi:hypothetical protein
MSEWISVDIFLPPFQEDVIALFHLKNKKNNLKIAIGYMETDGCFYYTTGNIEDNNINCEVIENVTHWMRLPEIPI